LKRKCHPDFLKDHKTSSSKMKELSALQGESPKSRGLSDLMKQENRKNSEAILNDFGKTALFSGPYDLHPRY